MSGMPAYYPHLVYADDMSLLFKAALVNERSGNLFGLALLVLTPELH